MGKATLMESIKSKLIVSCQALEDEPLHSSFIMSRMAKAAYESGAAGIRANSKIDIEAIKDTVSLPLIGIIKKDYPDSDVFITPTMVEAEILGKLKCDVIAIDGTIRPRPFGEKLEDVVKFMKKKYPNSLLMADCSNVDEAIYCQSLGFDFIGTTLVGYTQDSQGQDISANNFLILKDFVEKINIPIIAEGKIDSPEKARKSLEFGAHSVVVGSAITRPQVITSSFVEEINKRKVETDGNT